jgi:hypothetical protein
MPTAIYPLLAVVITCRTACAAFLKVLLIALIVIVVTAIAGALWARGQFAAACHSSKARARSRD